MGGGVKLCKLIATEDRWLIWSQDGCDGKWIKAWFFIFIFIENTIIKNKKKRCFTNHKSHGFSKVTQDQTVNIFVSKWNHIEFKCII